MSATPRSIIFTCSADLLVCFPSLSSLRVAVDSKPGDLSHYRGMVSVDARTLSKTSRLPSTYTLTVSVVIRHVSAAAILIPTVASGPPECSSQCKNPIENRLVPPLPLLHVSCSFVGASGYPSSRCGALALIEEKSRVRDNDGRGGEGREFRSGFSACEKCKSGCWDENGSDVTACH